MIEVMKRTGSPAGQEVGFMAVSLGSVLSSSFLLFSASMLGILGGPHAHNPTTRCYHLNCSLLSTSDCNHKPPMTSLAQPTQPLAIALTSSIPEAKLPLPLQFVLSSSLPS